MGPSHIWVKEEDTLTWGSEPSMKCSFSQEHMLSSGQEFALYSVSQESVGEWNLDLPFHQKPARQQSPFILLIKIPNGISHSAMPNFTLPWLQVKQNRLCWLYFCGFLNSSYYFLWSCRLLQSPRYLKIKCSIPHSIAVCVFLSWCTK